MINRKFPRFWAEVWNLKYFSFSSEKKSNTTFTHGTWFLYNNFLAADTYTIKYRKCSFHRHSPHVLTQCLLSIRSILEFYQHLSIANRTVKLIHYWHEQRNRKILQCLQDTISYNDDKSPEWWKPLRELITDVKVNGNTNSFLMVSMALLLLSPGDNCYSVIYSIAGVRW